MASKSGILSGTPTVADLFAPGTAFEPLELTLTARDANGRKVTAPMELTVLPAKQVTGTSTCEELQWKTRKGPSDVCATSKVPALDAEGRWDGGALHCPGPVPFHRAQLMCQLVSFVFVSCFFVFFGFLVFWFFVFFGFLVPLYISLPPSLPPFPTSLPRYCNFAPDL